MYFVNSPVYDPYFNLALEEYLFIGKGNEDAFFMLWQNDNTIVVGRNQNTIEEINQDFVREHNVNVIRRNTGGGAVYHDLGNINFSFIQNNNDISNIDFSIFTKPVIAALEKIGVKAELSGRNDLTIEGKKFSGNSQLIKGNRVLHHGTILFNADLDFIQKALNVKPDKIQSKGIKSVRSRVTNISEYLDQEVSVEEFKQILIENMFKQNELKEYKLTEEDLAAVNKLKEEKFSKWEWNYGKFPQYSIRKDRKFAYGGITISMEVKKGHITDFAIQGDFFGNGEIAELEEMLIGVVVNEEAVRAALEDVDLNHYISGMKPEELVEMIVY